MRTDGDTRLQGAYGEQFTIAPEVVPAYEVRPREALRLSVLNVE